MSPFRTPGAILCFHSVTAPGMDGEGVLKVSLATLRESLEVASSVGEIVTLGVLMRRAANGQSCRGLVAVTFDDAYAALPVAMDLYPEFGQVPITVFVVPRATEQGLAYWWDRVEDILPSLTPQARQSLAAELSGAAGAKAVGDVSILFQAIREEIMEKWDGALPPGLDRVISEIESTYGARTRHRAMTEEELHRFARQGTVTYGVHTMTHRCLPSLADEQIIREVQDCHDWLQERFAAVEPYLAFPFGLFDTRSIAAARTGGMRGVLTLEGRTVRRPLAPDVLPRLPVSRGERPGRFRLKMLGIVERIRDVMHPEHRLPVLPARAAALSRSGG
jgi:peptidoglycan/xylan/chitin deacetylase (PgdA/CDA1 family)